MSLNLILWIADIMISCGTVKFVDFCVQTLYTLEGWIAPGDTRCRIFRTTGRGCLYKRYRWQDGDWKIC